MAYPRALLAHPAAVLPCFHVPRFRSSLTTGCLLTDGALASPFLLMHQMSILQCLIAWMPHAQCNVVQAGLLFFVHPTIERQKAR